MQSLSDAELLAEYATRHSESAFAQLVERHLALVHSAALRQAGDAHLAEEITQAVFIILARKAASLARGKTVLAGWLCRTAHFAARDTLKRERRRQQREHNAYLESVMNASDSDIQIAWQQLAPLLDEAVAQLSDTDRSALVLRYYQQRPLAEVGAALGVGPDAAQKRVTRALEKLRMRFARRGVTLTTAVIVGAVTGNSVKAAPAGLAGKISVMAAAKGVAASTSTLTLAKGTLKIMAWTKMKMAVVGIVAIAVAGSLVTTGVTIHNRRNSEAGLKLFKEVQQKYASLDSFSFEGTALFQSHSKTNYTLSSHRIGRPCSYRNEDRTTGTSPSESLIWSDGDYAMSYISWLTNKLHKIKMPPADRLKHWNGLKMDTGMQYGLPDVFFWASDSQNLTNVLTRTNTQVCFSIGRIEPVSGHDCQRLAITLPQQSKTLTLWIGLDDSLIYQSEMRYEKSEATLVERRLIYFPVVLRETYTNLQIDPPFKPEDFIPDDVPHGLTIVETFP